MINVIWLFLLAGGIIYAGLNGRIADVTQGAVLAAENAVIISFKLTGVMCLWLGMLKIAEKAGLVKLFSIMIAPLARVIFPSVPRRHPAMGAIIMTVSANLLGLGNAVTPLGIKAMEELNTLNQDKEKASAAMCTFLAVCTTGLTFIPATVIAMRAAAGSANPAEITGAAMLVSLLAMTVTLTADRFFQFVFKPKGRRRGKNVSGGN